MLRERLQQFQESWEREHGKPLWTPVDHLVVGVSGGPDSLALLHLLAAAGLHPREKITVGHLNHQLRDSAIREARFVQETAETWGLDCVVREVDVESLAEAAGHSLEEAGRQARYDFLGELARTRDARGVLVAHTADDQVETVLMHMLRGTGLNGLRGMLPVSTVPGMLHIALLRPLLTATRREVEQYCLEHRLSPIVDATNEDRTFFRNRLRHELLPLLRDYNPRFDERMLNMAEVVRADVELLERLQEEAWHDVLIGRGEEWLRLDLAAWRRLPLGLRRRTLRFAVWQLRASLRDVSFRPVDLACHVADEGTVGAQAALPGDLMLTVEYDALCISSPDASLPVGAPQLLEIGPQALPVPGQLTLNDGWQLETWQEASGSDLNENQEGNPWHVHVDADTVGTLHVRGRQEGERFQPLGLEGRSSKISDFMINEKIPARLRSHWPIVANEQHLVWIVGYRIDERVRVTPSTRRVIAVRCIRVPADDTGGARSAIGLVDT